MKQKANQKKQTDRCPECGGEVRAGLTEMVYDLQYQVRIKNVPARVCSQCSEAFIAGHVATEVNRLVNRVIEDAESFAKSLPPRTGLPASKEIAIAV